MEELDKFLTEKGVRPTANRLLVVRELVEASRPLSLADLERSLDPMDKASIFRVLELLADKEIVHVIEDGSRSLKYEMCHSRDRHTINDQHVHFYCEMCSETFCLEETAVPPVDIPPGFMPRSVNYMLKGFCPKCAARSNRH